jgi:PAS domain S-box-containing protein
MASEPTNARPGLTLPEELWSIVLQVAPTGIFVAAPDGRLLEANPRLCEILGFSSEELLQRPFSDWLKAGKPLCQCMTSFPERASTVCQLQSKDGKWHESNVGLFRLAGGGLLGVVENCENCQVLKEAAATAQTKLDNAPIALFEVDRDAHIRYANQQACQSLGYTREELCALLVYDVDPNMSPERWEKHIQARDTQGNRTFESLHRRKDGTVFPVEVTTRYREIEGKVFSFSFAQDITERRRGNEALRENEERLRLALEGTTDGIWDWNLRTGRVYFSPRYYTMLGYEPGEFPPSYESWRQLLHPDDVLVTEQAVQHAIETQSPYVREFRLRSKNGEWLWILGRGKVAEVNAAGEAVRMAGSHVDISQRKQMELALQESQFFLQRSQAGARIGSYCLDISRATWVCSSVLEEICGLDSACPKTTELWIALLHPADKDDMVRYYREHVVTGCNRLDREYRIIRRNDGGERWVHDCGELDLDQHGVPVRIIGTVQDITERKQAEEALRESEARYRMLFHSNPQPMWVYDFETLAFLDVNEAAIRSYGYSREEFLQMTLKDIRPPEEIPLLLDIVAQVDKGFSDVHVHHRKKDGTIFDVEVNSHSVIYQGREARLVLASDITERLHAEAALRQLEQQLFQAQKMEAVGRLAGGVAHDFNNHLTVIVGYCRMILAQLDPHDPVAEKIRQVLRAGDQSAQLTQQLLAFSRKQVLQPKIFCPNAVVADTVRMLDRVIGEDLELVTTLDPALGAIQADPGQINQVLMNLAVNARDAMPNGGRITIQTSNVDLDERQREVKPGAYVLITVSDNGTGMDQATLDHIFEPFFTTKATGLGTGLGLAMVYGIVQQSGGSISACSEPGQGTTFKLCFPRMAARPDAVSEPGFTLDAAGGDETILVVEDHSDLRLLTVSILEGLGYNVLSAAHGAEALERSRNHAGPIHLMITDVVMPGMNGRDLAQRMAELRPGMTVLFTSGYTANVIASQGVLESGVAYLPKPFTPAQLAQKVHSMLSPEGGSGH